MKFIPSILSSLFVRISGITGMIFLLVSTAVFADSFPADPSKITVSIKRHKVGKSQAISNLGFCGRPVGFNFDNENTKSGSSDLSKSSQQVLLAGAARQALFLGGKVGGQKVFTCGEEWSDQSSWWGFEFFPTGQPWDTVWVVPKDSVVDIPYFPGYRGISENDLVCRYNDYLIRVPDQLKPLGVQVIQTSHSWSLSSYNLWTYFQFYIIPTTNDIEDLSVGWWKFNGLGIFNGNPTNRDDLQSFDDEHKISFAEDLPGNDDDGIGPQGFKIWPPEDVPADELVWSFDNDHMPNHIDNLMWDEYFGGKIDPPSADGNASRVRGFSTVSVGRFDVKVGDTLKIQIAMVVGYDKEDIIKNVRRIEELRDRGFALPSPPPSPPLRIEAGNHRAILRWDPLPGQIDVENWTDPFREDIDIHPQPFEGYKIFKSFNQGGPWTLLAVFDVPDNEFGQNTGLQREFIDIGLLNNFEYYYAVTAFTKPDAVTGLNALESPISLSSKMVIPGTQVPESVGEVFVVPNPYRGDVDYSSFSPPWESPDPRRNINNEPGRDRWIEADRRLQFVNVPSPSEVKIYTLAGDQVNTLQHNNSDVGVLNWNLTAFNGLAISSGIYIFTVKDLRNGKVQVGKFVVIK